MSEKPEIPTPITEGYVRLDTLVLLRWLAIAGQTLTICTVYFVFGFELPLTPCLMLIAIVAWSNVVVRFRFAGDRRLAERWTALLMGLDILQLAGLFYLTGGLVNPFILLIIAPVMVSASALSAQKTIGLGILVLLSVTLLAVFHEPLPWYAGERLQMPLLFTGAVWIALVCSLTFMGGYAFRVAEEGRRFANALAATELVLVREQHLHALDGLAAAAAHELGTPLATISVVTKELMNEIDPASLHGDDIRLLHSQAERCRDILRKLTTLGEDEGAPIERMTLPELIEEIVAPNKAAGRDIEVKFAGPDERPPVLWRNPGIVYGLGNILENAVDFARRTVEIDARWDDDVVSIAISDDGPGISEAIIDRLGDPYVTTRLGDRADPRGGLGLGFFIAKTLLERTGGKLDVENRPPPGGGARVTVDWPRYLVSIPQDRPAITAITQQVA